MAEQRSRDLIQSIERGVEVLRAFNGREATLTVAEIAARTGLARPVVRRILLTYEHLGYAAPTGGVWSLTPRVLEMGAGYFAANALPEIAHSYVNSVVERTGETCSIGVLDGLDVIHVARVENRRPLPDAVRIGQRLPAHATAIGKVMLAALTAEQLDATLAAHPLEPQTPQTITDVRVLRRRLDAVRARGWDVSIEELHPGQVAAAAPIRVGREVVGAIAVSSTTVRQNEASLTDRIVPIVLETAGQIGSAYRNANPQLFRHRY